MPGSTAVRARLSWRSGLLALLTALCVLLQVGAAPPPARGTRGMVAADHPLASQAGAEVLARGGNAVDAAIAAALSSGVVQPAGSGLGGGGFALAVRGESRLALDFREIAPAGARREHYVDAAGALVPKASLVGGRAVAVPLEGRGLAELHRRLGRLGLAALAEPAIRQARDGFAVGPHLARALADLPAVGPALFGAVQVPTEGDVVRRQALGATLRAWARSGGEALSVGPLAEDLAAAVQQAGGTLTVEDLAAHQPKERVPLVGQYRGYTVVSFPPPSSGGAVLLQALSVLEGFDLKGLGHNSSEHLHLLAEVFKHAYADRAAVMGDPDFTPVPVERLLDAARIEDIRRAIYPTRTFPPERYGTPLEPPRDAGTLHISTLDAEGLAVALTTTINTSFGSQVVAPRSGVLLNNQMDDFVLQPGVPNAFGLIGREANAVQAGKRPLSSMSPTIVLDAQGRVVLVVGASGGSTIISATLQVISNLLDFGMNPAEAVGAPRMHHQWMPDQLSLDEGYPLDVVRNLEARGHTVKVWRAFSAVQAILVQDGVMWGASDPRKGGAPAALR